MPPCTEERAFQEGVIAPDGTCITYMVVQFLTKAELAFYGKYGPEATGNLVLEGAPALCIDPFRSSFVS
jgi:hypothetical protein